MPLANASTPLSPGLAAPLADLDSDQARATVEAAVERAQAQHLLEGRPSADVAHVLLAAVTVFVFWGSLPVWATLTWLSAFVLTAGARAFNRRRLTGDTGPAYIVSLVRRDIWLAASLWGVWALLHVGTDTAGLLFLMLVFSGLVAAGTSTLVADRPAFYGFMGLLFVPLVLTVAVSGGSRDHASMLLLIVLFAPFMLVLNRRAHEIQAEQIRAGERLKMVQAVTDRRRDFLNALLTSAPSSVVVLDEGGTVAQVNPAFERMLGISGEDALGHAFLDLVTDDRKRPALATFLETVQDGRAAAADLPLRRGDGETLWIRLSGTLATGQAKGNTLLLGEDVTQQVEAREAQMLARIQAEEAARAKSAFLASMSHEIRTPMNGILGMVEILLDTPLTEQQQKTAEVIRSSGQGLLRILNDILDVSKIEAGQLDLELADFDLHELVGEVGRVFAGAAASAGDELVVDLGERVPLSVRGDSHRLRQILTNLVSNAVKFTRGGEVVVSVKQVAAIGGGYRMRFGVRDTGIGIPKEKQEAVFRAFEQADSSTTRTYGGTGLGLSISKRLVELMGGVLRVESEPGRGSEFFFELELEEGGELRPPDTRQGVRPVELSRHRFLVVDDNATARRIVRDALEQAGGWVEEAESVPEGLRLAEAAVVSGAPFDAVVLDHMMPGQDGFDFARRVHDDEVFGHPRILMVTSGTVARGADQARSLGVGGYLSKPVARNELLKALEVLLGRPGYDGPERRLVTRETIHRVTGKARILLAEDNPVNQQVAVALLKKRGHEVVAVTDGVQAVEAAERDRFDLVLMDIQMPEMDGLEATRRIRKFADAETLPIVALTAHAFAAERERSRTAGMNDFLAKPFTPNDLYDLVDRWARVEAADGDAESDRQSEEGESMPEGGYDEPPVDLEAFRATMREAGVEEVVETTVGIYKEEAPTIFKALEAGFSVGDLDEIRKTSHSLKSASGNIRANRLFGLLQELERLSREGDEGGVAATVPEVRDEFHAVMAYLESHT